MFDDDVTQSSLYIRLEEQDSAIELSPKEPKRKLKNKTYNMRKFLVIPFSRSETYNVIIGKRIEYQENARILGFKFTREGFSRGIEDHARSPAYR